MKVSELIEHLAGYDPDQEVYTLTTCECCTDFTKVGKNEIGLRDVSTVDRYWRHLDDLRGPAPPRAEWGEPGLVIAGSDWSNWPMGKS